MFHCVIITKEKCFGQLFFLALNGIHGRTTVLRWIYVDILHCFVDGFGNKTRIDYGTGVYMLLVGVDLSDENWGKLEA